MELIVIITDLVVVVRFAARVNEISFRLTNLGCLYIEYSYVVVVYLYDMNNAMIYGTLNE